MRKNNCILFAVLSGILWAASFPPLITGFFAYFILVFLWYALNQSRSIWNAIYIGYVWGFIAAIGTFWWIAKPTLSGFVALVLFLPLFSVLYCWSYYIISRKSISLAIIVSPILIVAVEYFRSFGKLGFPWINFAYTQTGYPILIQFADIFGNFGISFWVVAINCCVFFVIQKPFSRKSAFSLALILLLFGGALIYGTKKMREPIKGTPVDIAIVQSNIDPYKKWSIEFRDINGSIHANMIKSIGKGKVDLIIAPETATACYHRISPQYFQPIRIATVKVKTPLLIGTLDFDEHNRKRYYNSAILIEPDGSYDQHYNKIQLVPFAEQVPFQEKSKFLRSLNFGGSHFYAGKSYTIFKINKRNRVKENSEGKKELKFSTLICYESAFSWLNRKFRNNGAQFFVNITNDGWYGRSTGPYQHAWFNIMRAIENRVWIVRCANTGISMIIDPFGRIISKTSLFERTILTGTITANDFRTFYDKIGDIVGLISLGVSVPIVLWAAFFRKPEFPDRLL